MLYIGIIESDMVISGIGNLFYRKDHITIRPKTFLNPYYTAYDASGAPSASPDAPKSAVHKVKLSLKSCIIRVESL